MRFRLVGSNLTEMLAMSSKSGSAFRPPVQTTTSMTASANRSSHNRESRRDCRRSETGTVSAQHNSGAALRGHSASDSYSGKCRRSAACRTAPRGRSGTNGALCVTGARVRCARSRDPADRSRIALRRWRADISCSRLAPLQRASLATAVFASRGMRILAAVDRSDGP